MFQTNSYYDLGGLDGFDWGALINLGSTVAGGVLGYKAAKGQADAQLKALQEQRKVLEEQAKIASLQAKANKGGSSNMLLYAALAIGAIALLK